MDVSFIVVNYFSEAFTRKCLESILRHTRRVRYEIIVVDNHSGLDPTIAKIDERVSVLVNEANLGYGRACEAGARRARGKYFYFLNSDVEFLNDASGLQFRFMESHPEAGLVGPRLVDGNGRHTPSFDYFPNLSSKLLGVGLLRVLFPRHYPPRDGSLDVATEVDLVSGSSMFIRASLYRDIGGFDPQFFLYCEEEDLALRVQKRGSKVFHIPEARIMHVGGASSREPMALKKEFYISYFKFYEKHYGRIKTRLLVLLTLGQWILRSLFRKDRPIWRELILWMLRGRPGHLDRALPGPVQKGGGVRITLLTFLWLVLSGGYLIWWHRADTRPPAWDPSVHLHLAADYKDGLFRGTPLTNTRQSMYPPFYHLSLLPALSLGLPSHAKAAAMNLFYMGVLSAALILLAKRLGRPLEDGLLATLLTSSYSLMLFLFHYALIDFALIAWVALGMAFLYSTEDFGNRRWSLGWGLILGLGLLIKPTYPFFFVLPCLWMLARQTNALGGPRNRFWNFASGVSVGVAVALPWYGWQSARFIQYGVWQAFEQGVAQGHPDFRSLQGWTWYLGALMDQMGLGPLLVTLAGALWTTIRGRKEAGVRFLWLWVFSGYVGLSLLHNKDQRYDWPIAPALALLSVMSWTSFKPAARVRPLVGFTALSLFLIGGLLSADTPCREEWRHREIGELLQNRRDGRQPFLLVSVSSNHPYFFGRSLRWSMREMGRPMNTAPVSDPLADFTEFIITKTGDLGPYAEEVRSEWDTLRRRGRGFSALYPAVARFYLADGSESVVYQRDFRHHFRLGAVSMNKKIIEARLREALRPELEGSYEVTVNGNPGQLEMGRLAWARLVGENLRVRGVLVRRLDLSVSDLWLNLYLLWDEKKPGLLAFQEITPHLEVDAKDIQEMLRSRVKDLKDIRVEFDQGRVRLHAQWRAIRVSAAARVSLSASRNYLQANLENLRVAGIPIPAWILGKAHSYSLPLYPIPSFPGKIRVERVVLENNRLLIS